MRRLTERSLRTAAVELGTADPALGASLERYGPPPLWAREPSYATLTHLILGAEKLKPLGMFAGYHNHGAEWQAVEGKRPMDILATNTDKSVALQFDVGTCVAAGADPVAWITSNPGRIKSMHCKDWKAGGKEYAVLFGEGDAPWAKIFEAAESVGGIEYYLIEQEAGPADEQLMRAEQCLVNWKKMRS